MIVLDGAATLDFATIVRPGDTVVCAQGLAEPTVLTQKLADQRRAIGGRFTVFLGPSYAGTFNREHADAITFRSYCGTGGNGALHTQGILDIVPAHYSALPGLFADRLLPSDVVLLTAGEPDAQGRFNLGLNCDYVIDAARHARAVVVEVSSRIPWVHGTELPEDVRVTHVVRTHREPLHLASKSLDAATEQERAIAQNAAALVPDGATIELGVGLLPDLVLQGLKGKKNLGFHSGVIGDGLVDLIEAGVVNNALKPIDTGISVGGLLMGGRRLLDFAHRNRKILLRSSAYTHAIGVLSRIPNLVALNSAIEVDLTGQVNSEAIDGRYVGAIGGQVDFTRGGGASKGGLAVIMLASTAAGGKVGRIVPRLAGALVTTPRSDVDAVVTEFGVARLRGKSLKERARALIAIAHPEFRAELSRAA